MKSLIVNLEGWSQEMVRWMEELVRTLTKQVAPKPPSSPIPRLPCWPGVAPTPEQLRRAEIYKDAC